MKNTAKRLFGIALVFIMLFSMWLVPTAFAEDSLNAWDGTSDTSWYNDTDTEFSLSTAEQLAGFAELVNAGNTFGGKTVKLTADINLGGKTWTPIASFAGNFVGNNCTISNFHMDATEKSSGFFGTIAASNGLEDVKVKDLVLSDVTAAVGAYRFGTLANSVKGVVHNVTVKNVTVTTTHTSAWVGGMCAFMDWPWMTNCTVENLTVNAAAGADLIGGFACILQKNSNHVFDNLDVNGFKVTVIDTDASGCGVGGFVAQTQRGWEYPKVINSDVTGIDVTAVGLVDVGGFIAWPGAHTTAENCTAQGKIDVTGVTSADCFAGGFFGNLGWNADLGKMGHVVTGCSADVDIITNVAAAGGFVGSATNSNNASMYATFTDCSASGDITSNGTAPVGGFAGDADRGTYSNCSATGTVVGANGVSGGFIGYVSDVTPSYDSRYPAGTRDYAVECVTFTDCTETSELPFFGDVDTAKPADEVEIRNYVAQVGETKYETIAEAIANAADGDTVVILPGEYGAFNISNKNITIKGTVGENGELLTTIKGGNPAITGHNFNGTIADLKIVDAFKVMYAEPAGNVTVDNVYVTGATYGFHLVAYSTDLTWTIQNSYMDLSWANSFGVYDGGDAAIVVTGNTFEATNPYYEGGFVYHVNTFLPNVTVTENIFGENAKILIRDAVTDTSNIRIFANYHADGVENAFDEDSLEVAIESYYRSVDENGNLTDLVTVPTGSNSPAYTKEVDGYVRIWGEGSGNASESFVLKLYSEETLIATTTLNNVGGIIDGDVNVTWNFFYPSSNDEYWTTTWEEGHPKTTAQPTKVELYIDGTLVATTDAQMNAPDNLNPVVWTELGGVEAEVIEIRTWDDLKALDARVEGGDMLEGVIVKLMNDIDLYEMGTDGEAVSFNPIGANKAYFKGTFDGQGYTIRNMYQSGWALGYDWYNYGTIGLFAYLWDATVKNLTIENAECLVEGGNVAGIAGCAWGDCTFENITIKNSTFATYNNRAAGIVGYTGGEGTMTFKNITVDEDTVIAALWGSYDCTLGGVVGSTHSNNVTKYVFEDVTVACKLDCYNDVTASYKWYSYRMCGMLIGSMKALQEGTTDVDPRDTVTLKNVNITIGEWANQTYIWDDSLSKGCQRVEAGYSYGGVDVSQYPDAEVETIGFNTIIGGPQSQSSGYYGSDITKLEELEGFEEQVAELDVTDIALEIRSRVAQVGETYFTSLQTAIDSANGETVILIANATENITIAEGATVVIDLGGKTLNGYIAPCSPASLTISNGSVKNTDSSVSALEINAGTLTLTNVNIDSARHAVRIDGAVTATIDGGTYRSAIGEGTGTYHAVNISGDAYVTVKNGTFVGPKGTTADSGSAICTKAVVIIENGSFSGGKNSTLVTKDSGSVVITGGTFDQDPTAYVADGYKAVEADGVYTVVMVVYVAEMNGTKYETLAEAVAAAGENDTITLIKDVALTDTLTIPADKKIILDLAGYTVSQTKEQTAGYQMILIDGTLTVEDSVGGGKISYTDSGNGGEYISDTIYNRGVLVINGGTIENLSSATVASNGYPHAVDTYSGIRDTSVTINGGTVYCAEYSAIRMFCVSETYKNDLTITGGTIKGAVDAQNGSKDKACVGALNITGGTFETTANANNIRIADWHYYGSTATISGIEVSVSGGNFNGGIYNNIGTVEKFITGGTFTVDPSAYVVFGYEATESEGVYGVAASAIIKINNADDLLAFAALANAGNTFSGKTVELTDDIDLGGMTWTPIAKFAGKFYGNDYTISNFVIDATAAHGGFFNVLEWAVIDDLNLADVTATVGAYRFGTLARSINQTCIGDVTVKDVTVTTTNSEAFVAGLFSHGTVNSNMTVNNCTVENFTVNAQNGAMLIGGITTFVQKNGTEAEDTNVMENLHVKNIKVTVNDTDGYAGVGGLIGQTQTVWQNPHFKNCSVTGLDVTATGTVDVGGFMCYPGSWTYATDCTTEGKIDVSGVTSANNYAGGFFGDYGWGDNVGKGDHKITNCTADVDIITKYASAGGFVGSGTNSEGRNKNITFTDCEAKGTVTLAEGGTANIGGFAGEADRGIYIDCTAAQEPFIGGTLNDSIEIHNYVAQIGDVSYDSLDEALAAASNGQTVKLVADTETAALVVSTGITVDLAGYDLTAGYVVTFKGAAIIDSNSQIADAELGALIAPQDLVRLDGQNANYCPVWNGTAYNFGYVSVNVRQYGVNESGAVYYNFRYDFTGQRSGLESFFANDESTLVKVKLTWTTVNGNISEQSFTMPREKAQSMAEIQDKFVSLTVTGLSGIQDLSICVIIESTATQVAVEGGTVTLSVAG